MTRTCSTLVALLSLCAGCLSDVELPPGPPKLLPVESPTRRARVLLEGEKPAGTGLLNHGQELLAPDDGQSFSFELELEPGANELDLQTARPSGRTSLEHVRLTILFEPDFPPQPTFTLPPAHTNGRTHALSGEKPKGTSLTLATLDAQGAPASEVEIAPASPATTWTHSLTLPDADGTHRFSLVAKDARGSASEPVDFSVTLDRAPPALSSRYPSVGGTAVPTNALVSVGMDGPLALATPLDPDLLIVRDGSSNRVTGALAWNALSHSLTFEGTLAPNAQHTVSLDGSRFTDLAGNRVSPTPAGWTWTFTTAAGPDGASPPAPTVSAPPSSVSAPAVDLSGTKAAWTSVWVNGLEVVPVSAATSWSTRFALALGQNALSVEARSVTGAASPPVAVNVERLLVRPSPPTLSPAPPSSVSSPSLVLEGTREPNTSILLNGVVVVPRGPATAWVYNAELTPGPNELELRSRAADGTSSDPVTAVVDFTQSYAGQVAPGQKLLISFSLRDLSSVDPVRTTFETGVNHYSVDAWVEGPLGPGEACQFDDAKKERRNIRYVGTIVHYIGSKQGHTNPFLDLDYRAPDYLAALVSGGVFEPAIRADSDRRDDLSGAQGGELTDTAGAVKVTQSELQKIDGVTEATVPSGFRTVEWLPLDRSFQRIAQGEYLVHLTINLDRDPTWVGSNDVETCWGATAHAARGPHRVTRRLSLGSVPFTLRLGASSELGGPDAEWGAEQLRYLGPEGITFRWVNAP